MWFQDRKSTRLNSSHLVISYAVFCLKKKKKPGKPNLPLLDSGAVSGGRLEGAPPPGPERRVAGGFRGRLDGRSAPLLVFFFLMIRRPRGPPFFPTRPPFQ